MSCAAGLRGASGPARVKASPFQETLAQTVPPVPAFTVSLTPPDLTPYLDGNAGVPGLMHFDSCRPGPHVVVSALMHGNEFSGALALDQLLRERVLPLRGQLSFVFLNLHAFSRFDAQNPTASRYVDEDMNRLWSPAILDGRGTSSELARAREIVPVLKSANVLMDLHTMLWPGAPVVLGRCGHPGVSMADTLGLDALIVEDQGHMAGQRLIDGALFGPHDAPRARSVILEAGQHWEASSVGVALSAVRALLRQTCGIRGNQISQYAPQTARTSRRARVTDTITALSASFRFTRAFRNGEVIARGGTVLARDGADEIRTPYDDCILVMPNLRPGRGHTAIRLAHLEA